MFVTERKVAVLPAFRLFALCLSGRVNERSDAKATPV